MTDPSPVGSTPISEVVEDTVVRVAPGASLVEVAKALSEANIGAVVVGDERHVSGIVSERDLAHAIADRWDPELTRAADMASSALVWCDSTATVAEVAAKMMEHYVRHVLVEEDGALVGIVSARDLLGVYAAAEVGFE
jgi:CBS domain-containing protein